MKKASVKPSPEKVIKEDAKLVYKIGWEVENETGSICSDISWPYPHGEYVEPMEIPEERVVGILISTEVEGVSSKDVSFMLSPYRSQVIPI